MSRTNTIGIVGQIKKTPELIVEAAGWEREVYETSLTRMRPSGKQDTYILRFDGRAAGSREMLERLTEGTEVLVGGEIRTENVHDPKPEENRVKVYIYAEVIVVNDPPACGQNEVKICGNVCKPPRFREGRRQAKRGKRAPATSIVVAVNSGAGTSYIPCVCFGRQAVWANALAIGDYIEIYGRFQSRDYKKRIEGRKPPFLSTVYEVCAVEIGRFGKTDREGREDEAADNG